MPAKQSTEALASAGRKVTLETIFISKPHNLHVMNMKKPVKLLQEANSKSTKVETYEINNKITPISIVSKLKIEFKHLIALTISISYIISITLITSNALIKGRLNL